MSEEPAAGVAVLGSDHDGLLRDAVQAGGARAVPIEQASALIWGGGPMSELADVLARHPALRWVQLPSAGVEGYAQVLAEHPRIVWTSAKAIYGRAVAEHALAMLLALRRGLLEHAVARGWTPEVRSEPLTGSDAAVTILGAGGIATEFARLITPFGVRLRVVRRHPDAAFPVEHVQLFADDALESALENASVLLITLPLTDRTRGLIAEQQLRLLAPGAVVLNVGRGGVLDQRALLPLLEDGSLGGVGLDVTEPEPLPEHDALWSHPRCLVTSHTSNPDAWRRRQLASLVENNVSRYVRGVQLQGEVDASAGY